MDMDGAVSPEGAPFPIYGKIPDLFREVFQETSLAGTLAQ
jgi:hypothetical protein